MPFIQVNMPAEAVDEAQKREIIEKVTDTFVELTGAPVEHIHVHVLEAAKGGYGTGRNVIG